MLSWAHSVGMPLSKKIMLKLSVKYDFEAIRWLYQHGCPWSEHACANAALQHRIDFLREFRDNGAPWDELTARYAVQSNNPEILRYVIENGCPWDKTTIRSCIALNNTAMLDILEAQRKQIYFGEYVLTALLKCQINLLEWFYEHNYIGDINSEYWLILVIMTEETLPSLQWLYSKGANLVRAIEYAIDYDNVAALRYLHERGFPIVVNHQTHAESLNSLNCIQYLTNLKFASE